MRSCINIIEAQRIRLLTITLLLSTAGCAEWDNAGFMVLRNHEGQPIMRQVAVVMEAVAAERGYSDFHEEDQTRPRGWTRDSGWLSISKTEQAIHVGVLTHRKTPFDIFPRWEYFGAKRDVGHALRSEFDHVERSY